MNLHMTPDTPPTTRHGADFWAKVVLAAVVAVAPLWMTDSASVGGLRPGATGDRTCGAPSSGSVPPSLPPVAGG